MNITTNLEIIVNKLEEILHYVQVNRRDEIFKAKISKLDMENILKCELVLLNLQMTESMDDLKRMTEEV